MGGHYHSKNPGIKLLVDKYRKEFRIPENLDYYSEEKFKIAERKYLKYVLNVGEYKERLE
jgi:hypothetical protein